MGTTRGTPTGPTSTAVTCATRRTSAAASAPARAATRSGTTPRAMQATSSGKTSAGCTCKSSWKWYGKTYKGCANPTKRIDRGEERHSDWCMVVPGSCEKETQHKARVPAGKDWDVCETLSTFKLKLHF